MKNAVAAALVALCGLAGAGASAYDFKAPFSYYANGNDLKTVLAGFARAQGLSADVDSSLKGKVSGRFRGIAAADFLSAMGEAYDVGYYVLGKTIHFYRLDDAKRDFITVPSGSSQSLLESLRRSGFVADELLPEANSEGNMLTLFGPPAYIDGIRVAAAAYLAVQTEKIVMRVFPVKYAWADDITLTAMDQSVTIPGIASILRGMVMGQTVSGSTVSQVKPTSSSATSVPSLGASGLNNQSLHRGQTPPPPATPVTAGSISIMADPRVNAVLVSDAAYRMPYYEEVIRSLDKPVELVEIHAAIVDIDTDASRELGINLSGSGGSSGNWQGGGSMGASGGAAGNPSINTSISSAGALLSTIYTHGSDFFMAQVSALESENAARMLGRPSVLTVDNVQAVLENTTTYYIPLRGTDAVDLYKVDAGTVLRVTPHVIRENGKTTIKLAVDVQDDQSDSSEGYQSLGDGSSGTLTVSPIKQTRINTQAMVEVGQSLLIGGYYYETKESGESGVPLLKDIPLLGGLFRFSSNNGRRMERLILITPRIVTPNGANVPERVNEPKFHQKATQADYEYRLPVEPTEEKSP